MSDSGDQWIKTTVPLPAGHGWRCKPGNNLIVAERGAAAFEVPHGWIVRHEKDSLVISDKTPPADQARITLSVFHLPPVQGGWRALPLDQLFRASDPKKGAKLEIQQVLRPGLEMVWAEKGNYPDPQDGRIIRTRQLLARANLVQVLITFDVYQDQSKRFESAWKDLLRSLQVGVSRSIFGDVSN